MGGALALPCFIMKDFDFILADRLGVIQSVNQKYDLLSNSYLSFSGGKDSTVLHYLLDLALPNNNIPRVYVDTGIEYLAVRKFVKDLAEKDERFVIIKPSRTIKEVLDTYGYPFKSKEHSHILALYQHSGLTKSVRLYLGEEGFKLVRCPNVLRYQFGGNFSLKCSDYCCKKLKKEPFALWAKEHSKNITITGMRKAEGGQRASLGGCVITGKDGSLKKFHPLFVVDDSFEDDFIRSFNVSLCSLYYPPFDFKRTGCKGCPFSLGLQEQLEKMSVLLPNEWKQCEFIWKPVYEEYRRVGFRLSKKLQGRFL